jgi:hypothetical protein
VEVVEVVEVVVVVEVVEVVGVVEVVEVVGVVEVVEVVSCFVILPRSFGGRIVIPQRQGRRQTPCRNLL